MRRLYSGRVRRVSGTAFDEDIAATTQGLISAAGRGGGDALYRSVVERLAKRRFIRWVFGQPGEKIEASDRGGEQINGVQSISIPVDVGRVSLGAAS